MKNSSQPDPGLSIVWNWSSVFLVKCLVMDINKEIQWYYSPTILLQSDRQAMNDVTGCGGPVHWRSEGQQKTSLANYPEKVRQSVLGCWSRLLVVRSDKLTQLYDLFWPAEPDDWCLCCWPSCRLQYEQHSVGGRHGAGISQLNISQPSLFSSTRSSFQEGGRVLWQ